MGAIINKYKASGNLVLDLPFNQGTLNDKSGYGNNATAPTGVSWQNMRKMRALKTSGASGIVVADSASMRYTEATITLLLGRGLTDTTQRLYSHRDATGTRLDLYYTAGGTVTLGTTAGTSSWTYTFDGTERTVVIRMYSVAKKPDLFINGIYKGTGSAGLAVNNAATPPLTIGNYYSGAIQPTTAPIAHVVAINTTSVTNQEIAQLHEELTAEMSYGDAKTSNFHAPYPPEADTSCILDLDMTLKAADGRLVDLKGGRRFTPTKGPVFVPGGFNGGQDVHNGAYFISAASDATFFAGSYTFETVVKLHSASAVAGILGNSAGAAHYCGTSATGKMFLSFINGSSVQVTKAGSATLPLEIELHLAYVVSISGSDVTVTLYINGVQDATETFAAAGFTTGGSLQQIIGSFYTTSTFSDSVIYLARYFTKAMTAQEVAARYKNHAKLLRKGQCLCNAPMTLAAVAGGKINATDVEVSSGTWKISEDSAGKRWLECVTAGNASFQMPKAYGTWVFDLYKTAGATTDVLFAAATKGVAKAGAAQTAYLLDLTSGNRVQFQKTVAGTVTDIAYTAADYIASPNTYRVCVTRAQNGSFNIYLKGGTFTNWTRITMTGGNPVTDTTITSAKYAVMVFAAGDKMRGFHVLEGVIDPTVNPELIPG